MQGFGFGQGEKVVIMAQQGGTERFVGKGFENALGAPLPAAWGHGAADVEGFVQQQGVLGNGPIADDVLIGTECGGEDQRANCE